MKDGDLLNSMAVKANAENMRETIFNALATVTSLYISQKVNELKPATADFKVVFVKDNNVISIDEMVGNVLMDKVIEFLTDDVTKIYDAVKLLQQELEQWNVELIFKNQIYN